MVLGINGGAIAVPSLVLGFAARTKSNATSCSCPPTVLMYYVRNECLDVLLPTYSSAGQDLVPPCPQHTNHTRYADVSSARLLTASPGLSVEHVSFHFEKRIRSRQLSDVFCTSVEPSHHRLVLPIARSSPPPVVWVASHLGSVRSSEFFAPRVRANRCIFPASGRT